MTKIEIHAPTAVSKEEKSDRFYKELSGRITEVKDKKNVIPMGGWNSRVGLKEEGEGATMGNFGYETHNERGWKLSRYCEEYNKDNS